MTSSNVHDLRSARALVHPNVLQPAMASRSEVASADPEPLALAGQDPPQPWLRPRVVDAEHPLGRGPRRAVGTGAAPDRTGRAPEHGAACGDRVGRTLRRGVARIPPARGGTCRRPPAPRSVASPAAMPLAMAKLTPSSQMPAARHNAAASPATSSPSPDSSGIIANPASGIRCAEYSLTSPPSTSGAMAGCALRCRDDLLGPMLLGGQRRQLEHGSDGDRVEVRVDERPAVDRSGAADDLDVDAVAARAR